MIKEKSKSTILSKTSSKRSSRIAKKIDPSILMYDNFTPPISESLARELDEALLSFKKKTYSSDEVFKLLNI